jgi:aspartate 1-decarboxylase
MKLNMLKAKIHRATVTDANLNYEGSISICPKLLDSARMLIYERVEIYNCNNGARFATYIIKGNEGEITLNGAAARHAHPGDKVIICAYADFEQTEALTHDPSLVFVNDKNEQVELT